MLKREVVELRRAISPLTGALAKLTQDHNDLITKEVRRYLRDVLDHQTHAADKIGSYDELLTSLVNAALGKVAMQQNTDMRKISAWVGIAAFPTMLAGIYGMNFEHMPELAEPPRIRSCCWSWSWCARCCTGTSVRTAGCNSLPTYSSFGGP